MGADTNLLSSIGCGEECRRRCLVSVVGDTFVSQRACLLVFVSSHLIYCYVFVCTGLTDTVKTKKRATECCQDRCKISFAYYMLKCVSFLLDGHTSYPI